MRLISTAEGLEARSLGALILALGVSAKVRKLRQGRPLVQDAALEPVEWSKWGTSKGKAL